MVRLKDHWGIEDVKSALFQFHYGTIKRLSPPSSVTNQCYFNSTMVRLKDIDYRFKVDTYEFQFHYGTIKRQAVKRTLMRIHTISIPLWYD